MAQHLGSMMPVGLQKKKHHLGIPYGPATTSKSNTAKIIAHADPSGPMSNGLARTFSLTAEWTIPVSGRKKKILHPGPPWDNPISTGLELKILPAVNSPHMDKYMVTHGNTSPLSNTSHWRTRPSDLWPWVGWARILVQFPSKRSTTFSNGQSSTNSDSWILRYKRACLINARPHPFF